MDITNINSDNFQNLLNTIENRVGFSSVIAISYRNKITDKVDNDCKKAQSICLLVLTRQNSKSSYVQIVNEISVQYRNYTKICVLLHKITDLATKQPNQQRFFDNAFRTGQRLLVDKGAPPYLLVNFIPARNWKADKEYWLKSVAIAEFYLNAADTKSYSNLGLCKIALLHTACLHIALGIIRIFIEYTPNEYRLKNLLDLCRCFINISNEIFEENTPVAIRRYKMLCSPPSMLNHWLKLDASDEDLIDLFKAGNEFLYQSKNAVNEIIQIQ